MTRANLIIKRAHERTIELHWGSDAYPEQVKPFLEALIHEVAGDSLNVNDFAEHNPAGNISFGLVGNPYFIYEVDLSAKHARGWSTKTRWVNAPQDWKARGWGCYLGENGRYGYPTWVKNHLVLDITASTTQIV